MKFLRSRRGKLLLGAALILVLFLVRPGVGRLRARIVNSISMALGRPVTVSAVNLRLLPQPGFDLENFVVADDPAFSAEPMLRASEVTASLRVSSLLRGRLEIARLSLSDPSLNLVRNDQGHWNLESLLERTAHTAVAPTSKASGETRPGFPYIEAGDGRINFKIGNEKKPYALTGADFSFWQDSENAWGMRLKAQPVRTDFYLTDTGTVHVEGTWRRAATLRDTPLQFTVRWDDGQLGQLTKLASGTDKGWRGSLRMTATLQGSPANLAIATNATLEGFRRYDILGGFDFPLTAECKATYSSVDRTLSDLSCATPLGDGQVAMSGDIGRSQDALIYDLKLALQQVPLQTLVKLASRAKKNIPDDLLASGSLDGSFQLSRAKTRRGIEVTWKGHGDALGVHLGANSTHAGLALEQVPFSIAAASKTAAIGMIPQVEVGPVKLELEKSSPAILAGWLTGNGYRIQLRGGAQLQRLLALARTVGLPAPQVSAEGKAKLALQVQGDWSAFAAPTVVGNVQLQGVRASVRGLNSPVEVSAADILLGENDVAVSHILAIVAGSTWRGSMNWPRPCLPLAECSLGFDLHTDKLETADFASAIRPDPSRRPWYRIFSSSPEPGIPFLANLRASGMLRAGRVVIHGISASQASASVSLEKGKLKVSGLRADVFGGSHTGSWEADFTVRPPQYAGTGSFSGVALGDVAQAMHDNWVTGTAEASYRMTSTGWNTGDLVSAASGTLDIAAADGTLPHISLVSRSGPLFMRRFAGQLVLRNREFTIRQGKLETARGIYQVSGTASLSRTLNIKLMRDPLHGFSLTGSLTEPRVAEAAAAETRAALKP